MAKKKKGMRRGRRRGRTTSSDLPMANNRLSATRVPAQPPRLVTNVIIRRVFRFFNTNAVTNTTTYTITPPKLGGLVCTAATSTSLVQMFESCRIHSITMWAAADTNTTNTGPPPMCSIEWGGSALGIAGPSFVESAYSVGATRVAKVKSSPSPKTQAGQWQGCQVTNTAAWFILIMSGQTIIDIDVSVSMPSTARTSNTIAVTGPATVGQTYYLALDNNGGGTGSTSNNIVPENSLITIT